MFEKIARNTVRKSSAPKLELTSTVAFLTVVRDNGFRLSYAGLASVARILGEDTSTQIPAQRGASLVKLLPLELQPFVCRKRGGYAKPPATMSWSQHAPEDLIDRPVIVAEVVGEAIEEWEASRS